MLNYWLTHHVSILVDTKGVGVHTHVKLTVVFGNIVNMSFPDQTSVIANEQTV